MRVFGLMLLKLYNIINSIFCYFQLKFRKIDLNENMFYVKTIQNTDLLNDGQLIRA